MICPHCNTQNQGGMVRCHECEKPMIASDDNPAGIEFISIPSGEFLSCWGRELFGKDMPLRTGAYQIGKYPVTNAQYKVFIYENPSYPVPSYWDASTRAYPEGKDNHPVCYVSFDDAQKFCKWGGYRLPTDAEWEKAARGTDGRTFPWGEDWHDGVYANTEEAGIADTTPVDKYPKGASPYSVMDMCGNISEWCNERDRMNTTMKVVRGGSYRLSRYPAECIYKGGDKPEWAWSGNGFRCIKYFKFK